VTGDRPPETTATQPPPSEEDAAKLEAPVDGSAATEPPPADAPAPEAPAPEAPAPEAPAPEAPAPEADAPPELATSGETDAVGAAAQASTPEAPPEPTGAAAKQAPVPKAAAKRAPRPREPLPWPELRAAATMVREAAGVEDLKDLFRLLPDDVRGETVDGVREYRKGARRPVSAYAGKSLARAVHTARRARRRPDSDGAVSEAIGQALAAEIILPKRDLLDRESKNARRRQKAEDDKSRDEKRRRAREESGAQGGTFGTYTGAKIRGLDELAKLFEEDEKQ